MMHKRFLNGIGPVAIMTATLGLLGCNPTPDASSPTSSTQNDSENASKQDTAFEQDSSSNSEKNLPDLESLKSGNMLYIVRDVAEMQSNAGSYIEQLKQSQSELQQAISSQDTATLQQSVTKLNTQLTELNQRLNGLSLKSQEVESIRRQILEVNQQALNTPLLNGKADLSKVNFEQIEKQLNSIQMDMLQLASLLIPKGDAEAENKS